MFRDLFFGCGRGGGFFDIDVIIGIVGAIVHMSTPARRSDGGNQFASSGVVLLGVGVVGVERLNCAIQSLQCVVDELEVVGSGLAARSEHSERFFEYSRIDEFGLADIGGCK